MPFILFGVLGILIVMGIPGMLYSVLLRVLFGDDESDRKNLDNEEQ